MSVLLSEKENCLNEWMYASQKLGWFDEVYHTITLTTKRIIISKSNNSTNSRKEISLDSVTAVDSSVHKKRPWALAVLLAIICVVGVLVMPGVLFTPHSGSVARPWDDPFGLTVYFAFFVITIPLILIFGVKTNFKLNISTNIKSDTESIFFSVANSGIEFIHRYGKAFKFEVDPVVADDIVNTIGLLLLTKNKN